MFGLTAFFEFERNLYHRSFQRRYWRILAKNRGKSIPPTISQDAFEESRMKRLSWTKIWCWVVGHTDDGSSVENSYHHSSGKWVTGWRYYCRRCNTKAEYPDKRSAYFRFRVWLSRRYKVPFL